MLTGKMCGRLGVNPTGIFQKIVSLSAGQLLGAGMMILVIGLTVSYQCSIKYWRRKNIESRIKGQKAVTWEIFYVAA